MTIRQTQDLWGVQYKHLIIGSITAALNGRISYSQYKIKKRAIHNKLAFSFSNGSSNHLYRLRYDCSYHYSPLKSRKSRECTSLYVYPEVKLSRDLIRHSGYKIVLDPSRADYCIVPAVDNVIATYKYDIAAYDDNLSALYLFTVTNYSDEIDEADFYQRAKSSLLHDGLQVIDDKLMKNNSCYIIPKSIAFLDILCPPTDMQPRKYISENQLPLDYMNTISVENLLLWRTLMESDTRLFEKVISNTDWRDYPVTLCTFFAYEGVSSLFYPRNDNIKWLLDTIGYKRSASVNRMCCGKIVQPKDWNMMQDYIMAICDVEPKGGFTDRKYYSVQNSWLSYTRTKLCIAPLHIDAPVLYENIVACL